MRTTLDIDDEVLVVAQEMARRESKTAGQVLSELSRRGLLQLADMADRYTPSVPSFCPFASRGCVVTNEMIDQLRDETGD
jgi:hypothetical protein